MNMHMVFLHANLFKEPVGIVGSHLKQFAFEVCLHSLIEDFSSVFGDPDDMVLCFVDRMSLFVKLHASYLTRAGRCRTLALTHGFTAGGTPAGLDSHEALELGRGTPQRGFEDGGFARLTSRMLRAPDGDDDATDKVVHFIQVVFPTSGVIIETVVEYLSGDPE